MTRENKAGLVVCGSFLCLFAAVVVIKLRQPAHPEEPPPASPTASIAGEPAPTPAKPEPPAKTPDAHPTLPSAAAPAPTEPNVKPPPGAVALANQTEPSPGFSMSPLPEPPGKVEPPASPAAPVSPAPMHDPDPPMPSALPGALPPPSGPPAAPAPLPTPPGPAVEPPAPLPLPSDEGEHDNKEGKERPKHPHGNKERTPVADGPKDGDKPLAAPDNPKPPAPDNVPPPSGPPPAPEGPAKPMNPAVGDPPPPLPGPPTPPPAPKSEEPLPLPSAVKLDPPPPSIVTTPTPAPVPGPMPAEPMPPAPMPPAPKPSNTGAIPNDSPAPVAPPPAPARPSTPAGSGPLVDSWDEQTYVTKPGDDYAAVSQHFYSSEKYAQALQAYNRNHPRAGEAMRAAGSIAPGDKIYVPPINVLERRHGDVITQPKPSAVGPSGGSGAVQAGFQTVAPAPSAPTYTVIAPAGEFMYEIAGRVWKNPDRWKDLAAWNKGVDPSAPLRPGTVLNLTAPLVVKP